MSVDEEQSYRGYFGSKAILCSVGETNAPVRPIAPSLDFRISSRIDLKRAHLARDVPAAFRRLPPYCFAPRRREWRHVQVAEKVWPPPCA